MPYVGRVPSAVPVTADDIPANSIDASKIVDGAITIADIADDAVTAAKLANSINTEIAANTAKTGITSGQASAITANTAKVTNATHTGDVTGATALTIADNAVTLAKMAGGTDGQIITYDASGNPVTVGPGTDGQVLTSTGAGSPPAFETAAGVTFEPMCRAYLGSSLSAIDDTVQIMPFNQTEYNLGSAWDTTNYKFTVPSGEAGYYLINAQLYIGNSSYGIRSGSLYINKSGSDIVYGSIGQDLDTNKTRSDTMSATTIRYLSVGNYIQIKGVCDFDSGSTTSTWWEGSTEVSIFKLRS